jgi:hypothetical protein
MMAEGNSKNVLYSLILLDDFKALFDQQKESKAQFAAEVPLQDPSFACCPCSQKTD